jgi:DNA-binding MarR family transcriptional regulator
MKLLFNETNSDSQEVAAALIEAIPLLSNSVRGQMRSLRTPGLSIPQFRVLVFLRRNQDASLSQVAGHIDLKLPTASKLVDTLVARKLVIRKENGTDRRYLRLRLNVNGIRELDKTRFAAQNKLAEIVDVLSSEQKTQAVQTLQALRSLFKSGSI